ncbi:MAG: hypothetical protein R3E67_07125 [Pseudomonadales bacterium]
MPDRSVFDNVLLPLHMRQFSPNDIGRHACAAAPTRVGADEKIFRDLCCPAVIKHFYVGIARRGQPSTRVASPDPKTAASIRGMRNLAFVW